MRLFVAVIVGNSDVEDHPGKPVVSGAVGQIGRCRKNVE